MGLAEKGVGEWGDVVELGDRTGPVVFHFRPTKYIQVEPDRLKDWEKLFMENVGLRPDRELVGWSGDPKETISGSNDDWDDCDYW
jgi:hypothetical protein